MPAIDDEVVALGLARDGFIDRGVSLSEERSGVRRSAASSWPRAYVTISGAYRASKAAPDYPDVLPLAQALIAANPDRILWGTDWPHPDLVTPSGKKTTDITPFFQIDDGGLLNLLPVWAPDAAIREKILVTVRLYGFEERT